MTSECFDAAVKAGKVRVLLFACQNDIDAERRVVSRDVAIEEAKEPIEALQGAVRVLEGCNGQ